MPKKKLTHISEDGSARMVDVSAKDVVAREAVAMGRIVLQAQTLELVGANQIAKGSVLAAARIAGIQAAKRTGELIPLCHPLALTSVEVDFEMRDDGIEITC